MSTILFVCTANICRSPMAQAVFNALAQDADLPFRAESAGTAALEGRPIAPNAVAALGELGIRPEAHSARQVEAGMLEGAELVLAMGPNHAAALRRLGGEPSRGKVHVLSEYTLGVSGEIPDPYGHTVFAFRGALRQLYEHAERVVDRLGT